MRRRVLVVVVLAGVFVGACSSANAEGPGWTFAPAQSSRDASPAAPTTLPSPTAVATASPTPAPTPAAVSPDPESGEITIVMTDTMRFAPGRMRVTVGEPVTFVVKNAGVMPHEFFVGDETEQEQHAVEMAPGGHGHGHEGAIRLEGGASDTLTLTFEKPGTLLAGCHEPGHYAAGMVATIEVVG